MAALNIKATHKVVKTYYDEINQLGNLNLPYEGAVSPAFAALLRHCGRQFNWTLAEQFLMKPKGRSIRVDGALLDEFRLLHGVWEAKDSDDDLEMEVKKKFNAGYPKDNIIFQAPEHAIIWQNGNEIINDDISQPAYLIDALKIFFDYKPPQYDQWEEAVEEFKLKVPELGAALLKLIENETRTNRRFIDALDNFTELCKSTINPNLSRQAVEEMLIQHLLTERLFRKIFDYADFTKRNIIANEIEKVITALTSQHFSRHEFLKKLDRFYIAIERTAETIDEYSQKQAFINTIYEKFFQGFSIKVADTHGIVYTPQPIVSFMVKSVEEILKKEFGRNLSDKGVHVIDPFVGTGNFITHIMQGIKKTSLSYKYSNELHCNEVMLMPYYIASMNIEHEFYEYTNEYRPFEGICLVDTFELAEDKQISLFTKDNTQRVEKQKEAPIFVIIGNPPYNAKQINENDNSKNRKYPVLEKIISETYAKDSRASNKNALSDVYVKAIRWASDRLGEEGIIAFVTNDSFSLGIAFDGMRMHLSQNFDEIFILDLKGNVRENPQISGTTHNVFGIKVGVSINIFVKRKKPGLKRANIYYAEVDESWRKEQKYDFLEKKICIENINWKRLRPDIKNNWFKIRYASEFDEFISIGTREAKAGEKKEAIFRNYSIGVQTGRDDWAYNYSSNALSDNICKMIEIYNTEVIRWHSRAEKNQRLDDFILSDNKKIKWSSRLKECLERNHKTEYSDRKIRNSLYRPFCFQYLYFDSTLVHRRGQFPKVLPVPENELENKIICVGGYGRIKFAVFAVNHIPDLNFYGDPQQSFPFYTYNEDGEERSENITDWIFEQFKEHYKDQEISKWDIFYYVYGILYHPKYRKKYAENLKRELPRIPFAPDFWAFSQAGKELADLHINYEDQKEYPLEMIEKEKVPLNWRVEKMRLSKDKTQIIYNEFLTLSGIPAATFEYRLGNRSALDWIIDQYRIKTNKRSGIVNDPNNIDDPEYVVRLIKKVITVSLKTVEIVKGLPGMK